MIPGSANPLLLASAAAAGGYQVQRSLRFNSSDSAFCSRTPAVAGNRRTWTWAGWVKRSALGAEQVIFSCMANDVSFYTNLTFEVNDKIYIYESLTANGRALVTTQLFRDPSAWFHILLHYNTTDATNSNKAKLYINGIEVTQFDEDNRSYLTSDASVNRAAEHNIGKRNYSPAPQYLSGYLADIHFIDGQALTPSSFTEVSATTGQLIPKTYSGSYGTNGFQLKFADNSSNTAATLGKDTSGNSNNWTPNNLSVTAGAGNDSLVDTPTSIAATDTGVGGEIRGNYCTMNPLANGGLTLSNGNLDISRATASWKNARGTIAYPASGKWYWEYTCSSVSDSTNGPKVGIVVSQASLDDPGGDAFGWAYLGYNATKWNNGVSSAYGATYTNGDVIGVAFDADAGTLVFYKNGASQGTAFSSLSSGPYFPVLGIYGTGSGSANFGQRAFAYPVSGFKALVDTNLPAPVVAKPNTLMDVIAYSGSGASRTFTDLTYSPDLVWIKQRSGANNHRLYDVVRGATKALYSNLTDSEGTDSSGLTAFTSNGFTLGDGDAVWNASGQTYAAWCWDAGTSTVSNTAGSITSQVRANVSAGFSVVTYTGNGTAGATIGHGLGVAPELIIVKVRTQAYNWFVYHKELSATKYIKINTTDAAATLTTAWNNTAPTSTVFSVGTDGSVNQSSATYVAYCFAPVVGYSSFGSYTGNGSTDGPFVYTGFRPRWILIKVSAGDTGNWWMYDSARSSYNLAELGLYANLSTAEFTSNGLDMLSNGFKIRTANGNTNGSGYTFVYAAFAENPFQYARAR